MTPPLPRSTIGPSAAWLSRSTAVHQHVEHRLLGVDVVVEEPLLEAEAGVVDQQVDRAGGVGEPRLDRRRAARGRSGRRPAPRPATPYVARSSAATSSSRVAVAGDEHQVVAPRRRAGGRRLWPMPAVAPVTRAVCDMARVKQVQSSRCLRHLRGRSGMMGPDDHRHSRSPTRRAASPRRRPSPRSAPRSPSWASRSCSSTSTPRPA